MVGHHRKTILFILSMAAMFVTSCLSRPKEPTHSVDPSSVRTTAQGKVVGFASDANAQAWLGIPFAKPPVGELRWRAPLPPERWKGTFEALRYGPSCMQFASPGGGRDGAKAGQATGSENCLTLNVFAPRRTPERVPSGSDRLPVMVWIHGGGNTIGDATVYDGSLLAGQEKLIIVTIHYRLGAFGWFSHPALRGKGTNADDHSGNFGTLDIVRALTWVQDNIEAFGGDPTRVTVFGESAGGSNTFTMLLSPRAKGLFQHAIAESGSAQTTVLSEAENYVDDPVAGDEYSSREVILKLLIRDGKADTREAAKRIASQMSTSAIADYLRDKSAKEILSVYDGSSLGGMYRLPTRFRDGVVLPAVDPMIAFERGDYNRVPAILGTNRDESRLFMLFSSDYVTRLFGIPLWLNNEEQFIAEASYQAKAWKVRGVDAPATRMRGVQGASIYAYRFDWDEEPKILSLDLQKGLGAAHGMEIPFVFGWLTLGPATKLVFPEDRHEANLKLSRSIMSYWSQFAYTGDPGRGRSGELPLWSSWSNQANGNTFLILDTDDDGGIRMSPGILTDRLVLDSISKDPLFADSNKRCALYASLMHWSTLNQDQFATIDDGACAN